ncbi:hypothetical protein [Chromobacterium haemolyticum]|uniref:hypothetical protein n=1 Tax=Chromobacterium haemolyticum TaxID=394935 RepID=UPI0012F8197F|nr:hypothetical protein [Chromobacterium haemolyticum]
MGKEYKLTNSPAVVIRTSDGAAIPEGHPWWADYLDWLQAGNTPASFLSESEEWSIRKDSAINALNDSDTVVLRCYENSKPVPAEWVSYRSALREIISAASGDASLPLPSAPEYPPGT